MKRRKLTLSQTHLLGKIFSSIKNVGMELSVGALICLLRKRLQMNQKQLARRSKLPQSYIAKVEKDRVDCQLKTLRKIFDALCCDLIVVPKPRIDFDEVIRNQAYKAAKQRVAYLEGTMALEEQLPTHEMSKGMVLQEQDRLIDTASNEIWEV